MRTSPPHRVTATWIRVACIYLSLTTLAGAQSTANTDRLAQLRARIERGERSFDALREVAFASQGSPELLAELDSLAAAAAATSIYDARADDALASEVESMLEWPSLTDATRARIHYAIGEIRFRLGQLAVADASLATATSLDTSLTFHIATRRCLLQMERGDMTAAFAMSEAASASAANDVDRRRTAQTRADLALRIGLFDEAAKSLALARGEDTGDVYDLLATQRIETELALALEDFERARETATAWHESAMSGGDRTIASRQRALLAQLRTTAALEGPDAAIAAAARLLEDPAWLAANRAPLLRIVIELELARGSTSAARAAAARLLAGRPFRDLDAEDLVAVSIAAVSDRNIDRDTLADLRAALDAAWQRQIESWISLGSRAGRLAFLQLRSRRNLGSALMSALALELGDACGDACLDRILRAERAGTTAREIGLASLDATTARAQLTLGGARLIVYLPAPARSHCIEVTEHGSRRFDLPSDSGLRVTVRKLRSALGSASDEDALRRIATSARSHVLPEGKTISWLASTPIVVVGRELLAGLPFEALPTDKPQTQWLGLATPISYLPSLQLGAWLASRAPVTETSARALFATGLSTADREKWSQSDLSLSHAQMAEPLRRIAAEHRTNRDRASKQDLMSAPGGAMALFAHGIYDAGADAKNGFLLAATSTDSGAVFANSCATLRLAPFTALAVCGAARTSLRRGDDGGGDLVDAAMRAGATAVLCSEFDLRVDDAVALTREAFASLARGNDAARALLDSRIAHAAAGNDHPARWASMRLDGLGSLTVPLQPAPDSTNGLLVSLGAVASALGVVAAWWRARGASGLSAQRDRSRALGAQERRRMRH